MRLVKAMTGLTFFTFITMSAGQALAQDVQVHPTFPLYERDAADVCGAQVLQIRVSLANTYEMGIVKLDLYMGEEDFLDKKGKLRKVRVPAVAGPQKVCINVDQPGTYAIASYHDLDADRDLDKKWNFKPKEPYALSTNPNITELRLPKFTEADFEVGASGADIELIYYGKKAGKMDGSGPMTKAERKAAKLDDED